MNKLLIVAIIAAGCGASASNTESRFKNYMEDSVTQRLHDPESYEFVSMRLDTFYGREQYEKFKSNMREEWVSEEMLAEYRQLVADYESNPKKMDSILNYSAFINYRAKNAFGAKVVNKIQLVYNPYTDAMMVKE